MDIDFTALRRNMVDCQLRTYDVTSRPVLAAMDEVPREVFVPAARREIAYIDQPVDLESFGAAGRVMLAPMTAGRMLQTLDVKPGMSLLDYACGTGYTAAVASRLGARVTAYDGDGALRSAARHALQSAGEAEVAVADDLPKGPFDLIFVNGSCEARPEPLFALLADGGRIVFVEGAGRAARVMLGQRSGEVVSARPVFDAAAPVLQEFRRPVAFAL
jgi:protein-L-isoaspartate(D-aspartate) O-methyltransferase